MDNLSSAGMSIPAVAIVVAPGFNPFHFSIPCMIFGPVLPERQLFDLCVCAETPGKVRSNGFISVDAAAGLEALTRADIVIVPYWQDPREKPSSVLLNALIDAHRRGAEVVGLCLGAYVLAYAGLLDDRRAATHWEFECDFVARFPRVHLDANALYVADGRLITSAGTAAGLDCCLYLVRQRYGSAIANRIARRMVVAPYREGGQTQFIERPVPETTRDARINQLLEYLRKNLDRSHDLDSLARLALMSRRTFTRQFQRATGMSTGEWLTGERLQRAQALLEESDHSVEAIAGMTGFQSAVTFRQHFKARFSVSPGEWRKAFRGTVPNLQGS